MLRGGHIFRIIKILIILLIILPAVASAQLPRLASVPDELTPGIRESLQLEKASLEWKRSDLRARVNNFNSECASVKAGSAEDAECRATHGSLMGEMQSLATEISAFNMAVKQASAEAKSKARAPTSSPLQFKGTSRARIGATGQVLGEVLVEQSDGSWKQLTSGTTIRTNDRIRTGSNGRAQLRTLDETFINIGRDSDFVLEKFVYDPFTKVRNMIVSMKKGIIRYYNKKKREEYERRIKLRFGKCAENARYCSVASVKGTDFIVQHNPTTNTTTIYVREGEFEVTPTATGKTSQFSAGQIVVIDETGVIEVLLLTEQKWKRAINVGMLGSSK